MIWRVPALLAAAAWGVLAAPAQAQAPPCDRDAARTSPARVGSFVWENDALIGPDRDYSNGLGLIVSLPARSCAPLHRIAFDLNNDLDRRFFDLIPGLSLEDGTSIAERLSFALAHQIFTPEDLTRADPDPADRPYAGWLYYSAAYVREVYRAARPVTRNAARDMRALSITQIDVGMIGPSAQGEALQTGFHHAIDADVDPRGWAHQIHDEPGIVLRHERKVISLWDGPLIDFELEAHAGAALGNVATNLSAGLGVRLGYNLGRDYGPPRLRPGLSGSDDFRIGPEAPFSLYVLGAVAGRAVGRNIFLDGNTFRDSRSVDKKHLVADYQLGAALVLPRIKLAVTRVYRTQEFAGQDRDTAFDSFSVSVKF